MGRVEHTTKAVESHAEMKPTLRAACDRVRDLWARASRDDVRARHEIGTIIGEVKRSRNKYGARAVEQMSSSLGMDSQTLYRCANVANCWTKAELEQLLAGVTRHGQPLSWSHFVLLAGVRNVAQRDHLYERAVGEALSVRVLAALVDAAESTANDARARVALERLQKSAERWCRQLEEMHSDLLAELHEATRDESGARAVVDNAIAANQHLENAIRQQLERLSLERQRFESGPVRKERGGKPRLLAGLST